MKQFCRQRPSRTGMRLLGAAIVVTVVALGLAIGLRPAAAQMQFDYNGDGEVHCDDFEEQFPDTFTEEATKALQQYPDELSDLNRDSKEDDSACEGQSADAEPGDGPARAKGAKSTPAPTPTPAPATAAPVAAPAAPASATTENSDIPADVMARIEGCAVVAISSHDVTAAGCPGVGTLIFHTPDDAPPLPDTVIMNPGAALPQTAPAPRAPNNNASTTNTSKETSNGKSSQDNGKANKSNKDNASDTSKSNKNKNSDDSKKDKNNKKHKDKKGKNDKHNKHGKKSKKQGKKGK